MDIGPSAAGGQPPQGPQGPAGRSLLARSSVLDLAGDTAHDRPRSTLDRVVAAGVRGALTTWVRVGMFVARLRGRPSRLQGDAGRTFALLAGLLELALEGQPLPIAISQAARRTSHIRLLATRLSAGAAMQAAEQALSPYTTTSSTTATPPVAVGYFAVRELLAQRARNFSLQVVHLTPSGPGAGGLNQVSIQLPRDVPLSDADDDDDFDDDFDADDPDPNDEDEARPGPAGSADQVPGSTDVARRTEPERPVTLDTWLADLAYGAGLRPVDVPSEEDLLGSFGWDSHAFAPEASGRPGDDEQVEISIAATAPATIIDSTVLALVERALGRLLSLPRPPQQATPARREMGILVRHWQIEVQGHRVTLTAAARTGGRRRPSHVVLSGRAPLAFAPASAVAGITQTPQETVPTYRAGVAVGEGGTRRATASGNAEDLTMARALLVRPVWWRSVGGRLDGDDVILYEAVVGRHRLRIRANDYPLEPMYTLLVGTPGAVTAALDLERWPPDWTRPVLS